MTVTQSDCLPELADLEDGIVPQLSKWTLDQDVKSHAALKGLKLASCHAAILGLHSL